MGKLAERLSDPARSGVYRIETTEAVEEAAALNRYRVARIALDGKPQALLTATADNDVIVVSGFERFFHERPQQAQALLAALRAGVQGRRGPCSFVAFLDPRGILLTLPPLYNWTRQRSA